MRLLVIALLSTTCAAHAQDPPGSRFSGTAALRPAASASVDGRFALRGELRPTEPDAGSGRFALEAKLAPDFLAKSATTACAAGVTIFGNGFEN